MASTKVKVIHDHGPIGFVLFTAWLGSLVYFVNQAVGFGEVVVAVLKSVVWPAYLIYHTLSNLGV